MTGAEFFTGTPPVKAQVPGPGGQAHLTAALLQATLSARRITAMVALAWDGPQMWAFSAALGLGEEPGRVERLAGALALAAGAESCRVSRGPGRLLIEIPKPLSERRPLRAGRLDGLTPPSATSLAVGITTGGQVAWLDLADERTCHLIIGGTTGSGKTVALHWLLYRLLMQNSPLDLRLVALDPKHTEMAPFEQTPHLLHPVVSAPLETARLLAWTTGELDRRAVRGERQPRLVVVIEEVADLMQTSPEAAGALARIAQIGRGLGVHLIATTQQPGARSLGEGLMNFPARLVGRVASATLTYGAAGRARTMADQLLGRGDFLLLTADSTIRVQVPLIDGRQFAQLPRTAQVASLEEELPSLVEFADRAVDPRGGQGRRELGPTEYAEIEGALRDGAGPAELRTFGIGWNRAQRLYEAWRE